MKVVKRNGVKQEFDKGKIYAAVRGAVRDVLGECDKCSEIADNTVENVIKSMNFKKNYQVEEIQDLVELSLMQLGYFNIAKAYIEYRQLHKMIRNQYDDFMQAVSNKLTAKNIENQNANLDESSFGGRVGMATNLMTKQFALDYCMSDMARSNHLNNEIYIHDLDSYATGMHNCLSIPYDKLLSEGFKVRQTDVRPANSVNTAFQLVAVIAQLQSLMQFGGVSATHIDWTMVPYVRKSFKKHFKDGIEFIEGIKWSEVNPSIVNNELSIDSDEYKKFDKVYNYAMVMTTREIKQAVEALFHNLNTLQSRSGNQLPFSSINYGTCTLPEGRLVIKYLLEVSIEGLGKYGRTSIFPCCIFQCMKGVNRKQGDPNYDLYRLALKSTSLRLYPNYANVDWSGNAGYDRDDPTTYFSTMGCRTANGFDINAEKGVNPQTKDGRGNVCPTSVVLPTIAMKAVEQTSIRYADGLVPQSVEMLQNAQVDEFMKLLNVKIDEAKDMLIERFEYICSQSPKSASFMYENGTMLGYNKDEGIRSALKHGTLAIGQLGLAETLQILIGCDHTTDRGMAVAKKIEQLFKDKCARFKEEYKLNFGVYYTPAESLCYTAMSKFKEKYGVIPKVSDKKYFTNSIHVPVYSKVNAFEKIDIESQLTGYSSAGCITYVELDSTAVSNIDAIEKIVNYAMDKDIPYFALNTKVDMCEDCGHQGELNTTCPVCGSSHISRLRRVTGYLTGSYKDAFNDGKIQEVEMRVEHTGVLLEE